MIPIDDPVTPKFDKSLRERLLEAVQLWPHHRRLGIASMPEEILVSLIYQAATADQETIGKTRESLATCRAKKQDAQRRIAALEAEMTALKTRLADLDAATAVEPA